MEKEYWVYIITNDHNTVLYTGVTSNLSRRIEEHKGNQVSGFTKKYNAHKLVFAEAFSTPDDAITAEKKIKAGSRKKKIALIESVNPEWNEFIF